MQEGTAEPVIMTQNAKAGTPVEVLVDSMTPVKNISRYAANNKLAHGIQGNARRRLPDYTSSNVIATFHTHFERSSSIKQQKEQIKPQHLCQCLEHLVQRAGYAS